MTGDEQLEAWARGDARCPNDRGECCPDFSCCKPQLAWPPEKRAKFVAAEDGEREKMMMGALGDAIALAFAEKGELKRVRVTRGDPADDA